MKAKVLEIPSAWKKTAKRLDENFQALGRKFPSVWMSQQHPLK
jgi:hypothetical protein